MVCMAENFESPRTAHFLSSSRQPIFCARNINLPFSDTLQMIPQRRPNKNSRPYLETESDYGLLRPSLRAIQISCYSCMSSEFEKHWSTLSLLYNRPKNFTDLCLDIPRRSRIGYVPCDSACLTIVERRISGGQVLLTI